MYRAAKSRNALVILLAASVLATLPAFEQDPGHRGAAHAQSQPDPNKRRQVQPADQPRNIFEALFPGLRQERIRREQAIRQQELKNAPAVAKISAPQYYTYKPERMVRIDLAALVPAAAVGTQPAGTGIVETVGSVIAPAAAAAEDDASRQAFEAVSTRFAGLELMTEPAIAKAVVEHYRQNPKLLWLNPDLEPGLRAVAAQIILADAGSFGLVAEDYSVELPNLPPEATEQARLDAAARFEIAMTARTVRYALDAGGGMVDPNLVSGYHDFPKKQLTAEAALKAIAEGYPTTVLPGFHPANAYYKALVAELARLDGEKDDEIVIADTLLIKPGDRNPALPLVIAAIGKRGSAELKSRFQTLMAPLQPAAAVENAAPASATAGSGAAGAPSGMAGPDAQVDGAQSAPAAGTMPGAAATASTAPSADPELYTAEKVELVKAFQKEAGLGADGIIGRATVGKLTGSTVASKRQRVVIALEQLRWHPHDLGNRYVFINQPEFRARYVDGGTTKLDMRVVVGTKANQTSFFHDMVETVEYNPYWGVPQSILVNEFLPKLRANPAYLDERGYEVTDNNGNRIPSAAINWYAFGGSVPFNVRQSPGEANALGELKILFPNKHAIYMHDTPARDLFKKDFRAYSHGCVRLAEPREMAAAVLGKPVSHVEEMLTKGHGQDEIVAPFPVYVAYFTAWPNATGTVEYYADMYERDAAVVKAFAAIRAERGAAG